MHIIYRLCPSHLTLYLFWVSLNNHNSVTVCVRKKPQLVSERREDELYGDIWCITVAQSIHEILLCAHRQKNQVLDFTICASHYCNSSTILG